MRPMISAPRDPHREPSARRDPAPSRWGYRYQRMMLTPGFRGMVRVGMPLAMIALIGGVWFSNETNRANLVKFYEDTWTSVQQRPEFMVSGMTIKGADAKLVADIEAVLPLDFPLSSFDLDLNALRDVVEAISAVDQASLRVDGGGELQVNVTQRVPVAIWRQEDGLGLVDVAGFVVRQVEARADRLDLPFIAGDGATDHIAEALAIYAAAGPLASRMRGLVRMGERRWDVVLDQDQRILLPAIDPIGAFAQVVVMAQTQDLLKRDVVAVDMRNDNRPTLRLGEQAAAEMRRINASISGTGN